MLVTIYEDSMGNVTARPVNQRVADAMVRDALANGAGDNFDGSLFLQQPSIDDVRETFGHRAIWRGEVNDGARVRVDPWSYRHMLGYCAD